jgi:hypothetical protein
VRRQLHIHLIRTTAEQLRRNNPRAMGRHSRGVLGVLGGSILMCLPQKGQPKLLVVKKRQIL